LFTSTDAGALMRLADELSDLRVIPLAAVAVLQRLVFKYRPRGGRIACVDLAELAGDGLCKTTLLRLLDALERARLILKDKWGIVRNGRWKQMPNRYRLNTAAEARAAQIAAAEADEIEPEIVLFTVSLPDVSESNSWTDSRVLESSLPVPNSGSQEGAADKAEVEIPAPMPVPEPADADRATAATQEAPGGAPEGRAEAYPPDAVSALAALAGVAARRSAAVPAAIAQKRLTRGAVAKA
jgi:hypothetical protein